MNNRPSLRKSAWAFFSGSGAVYQHRLRRPLALLLALSLSGCMQAQAPLWPLLGSYFPSWLLCAFIGVITAMLARVLFIRLGIDAVLIWRLLVYVCLALAVAFICSLLLFAR